MGFGGSKAAKVQADLDATRSERDRVQTSLDQCQSSRQGDKTERARLQASVDQWQVERRAMQSNQSACGGAQADSLA